MLSPFVSRFLGLISSLNVPHMRTQPIQSFPGQHDPFAHGRDNSREDAYSVCICKRYIFPQLYNTFDKPVILVKMMCNRAIPLLDQVAVSLK